MRLSAFIYLLPILLAGCAGYRLGPTNGLAAGEKSIQINPFQNNTFEPRLTEPVTTEMRKRLQQDGTYRLATQNDGDIIVHGTIIGYERSALSFDPGDVVTPRDYTVSMSARIIAVERATGKTNLNQIVRGRTTVRVGNDMSSAERQAIPLMAANLARNAVSALADGSW